MATRDYWLKFGSGNPASTSGLAPTFITFIDSAGGDVTPPAITEPGTKGLYKFAYDPTQTIAFTCDGATTGLAASDRYIVGVLDAQDTFGVTLNAIGVTQVAQGATVVAIGNSFAALSTTFTAFNSSFAAVSSTLSGMASTLSAVGASLGAIAALIGNTSSSFGSSVADPTTIFGFLKRAQETAEGNQDYTKSSGVLRMFSRGSGTTTLIQSFTINDTATLTTKG